jgi:hypothetical protein
LKDLVDTLDLQDQMDLWDSLDPQVQLDTQDLLEERLGFMELLQSPSLPPTHFKQSQEIF